MSGSEPISNPPRLIEGKLGRLLRDANRELASDLDQAAAFRRVDERLAASSEQTLPRRTSWLVLAAVLGLCGVVGVRLSAVKDEPMLIAEDARGFVTKRSVSAATPSAADSSLAEAGTLPLVHGSLPRAKRRTDGSSAAGPPSSSSVPVASVVPPSVPSPTPAGSSPGGAEAAAGLGPADTAGPDCLSLARLGKTRDAEACFLKRAQGTGLGAEMALYEVARLRRDVLADAEGALRALAEYRARFPSGSLRREADMSQLELQIQLGRSEDALKQSAELLSSSSSGERAAELHFLRGQILRKSQSKYAAALVEYELAEKAGGHLGDVKYFRALCLEALGRGSDAAASFADYLQQPHPVYGEDARRRLEKLKP